MRQIEKTVNTILQLRHRIKRNRAVLEKSEPNTKSTLVEPLLEAVGWRILEANEVYREFSTTTGVADYALIIDNTEIPYYIMEVKSLETRLSHALEQEIRYCRELNVRNAIITNGDDWMMFKYPVDETDEDLDIFQFSVTKSDVVVSALAALMLQNPANQHVSNDDLNQIQNSLSKLKGEDPIPRSESDDDNGWISINHARRSSVTKCPTWMRFSDGFTMRVVRWNYLIRGVGFWLASFKSKELTEEDWDADNLSSIKRYVAHNRYDKLDVAIPVGENIYVESQVSGPSTFTYAYELLERCNVPASTVYVRFD